MRVSVEIMTELGLAYLPEGSFWDQPGGQREAADRFATAIGRAMVGSGVLLGTDTAPGIASFMACLDQLMNPATTPYRSVLLQWYDYLAIPTCTPIPDDLEELRSIVVGANTAIPVNTPSGLRSWVNAQLPFVEVSESLPLLYPPFPVPAIADGWWAVVEIWYSPLIDVAETVLCVSRPVVRGSNDIRLVYPDAVWSVTPAAFPVVRGDEVALLWTEQRAATAITAKRFDLGMVELESVVLPSVDAFDSMTSSDIFPLVNDATDVHDQIWTATAERVFPDGLGTLDTMQEIEVTL